jgi:hypothetical protein
MNKLFLPVLLLVQFYTSAQYEEYEKPQINGDFKSVNTVSYKLIPENDTFKLGQKYSHWSEGLAIFRDDGQIAEFNHGHMILQSAKTKIIYIYDENNHLKEKQTFDSKGNMECRSLIKTDSLGRKIEEARYDYASSQNVFVTERYHYNKLGLVDSTCDKTPESNGTYSCGALKYDNGGFLIYKDSQHYINDAKGNPLTTYSYKQDSTKLTWYECTYYDNDLLAEKKMYRNNVHNATITYVYEFDEYNNWVKKILHITDIKISGPKVPKQMTIREITYK